MWNQPNRQPQLRPLRRRLSRSSIVDGVILSNAVKKNSNKTKQSVSLALTYCGSFPVCSKISLILA